MMSTHGSLTKLLAFFLASVVLGCTTGRQSAVGFRLPENGDPVRGKAAFVELECYRCHTVSGEEGLPDPKSAVDAIGLGGDVQEIRTDGYLVTSIIHPSHRIRPAQAVEGESAMPDYSRMTVRQLVDLVAYLQSRYRTVSPPYWYY